MQVFRILPLETLSEQRRNSQLCRTCFMTVAKCIYGNNKPLLNKNSLRTIEAQFVQKQNVRTTRFGQNLLVLIKKTMYTVFNFPLFPALSCGSYGTSLFFSSYFSCVSHVFLPNPEIYGVSAFAFAELHFTAANDTNKSYGHRRQNLRSIQA